MEWNIPPPPFLGLATRSSNIYSSLASSQQLLLSLILHEIFAFKKSPILDHNPIKFTSSLHLIHFPCIFIVCHSCTNLLCFLLLITSLFFPLLSDLVADKTSVSVSLSFVLSTPVFLLALCHFHIGEEGNKKKKKSSCPRISPNPFRLSFPSTLPPCLLLLSIPPQAGPHGAPHTSHQRTHCRGRPGLGLRRAGGSLCRRVFLQCEGAKNVRQCLCPSSSHLRKSDEELINVGPI